MLSLQTGWLVRISRGQNMVLNLVIWVGRINFGQKCALDLWKYLLVQRSTAGGRTEKVWCLSHPSCPPSTTIRGLCITISVEKKFNIDFEYCCRCRYRCRCRNRVRVKAASTTLTRPSILPLPLPLRPSQMGTLLSQFWDREL